MTSDAEPPSFRSEASSQQPSTSTQRDSGSPDEVDEISDESDGEPEVKRRSSTRRRRSSVKVEEEEAKPSAGNLLSDDLRRQLDHIFENFLSAICSDSKSTEMPIRPCLLPLCVSSDLYCSFLSVQSTSRIAKGSTSIRR